jgi:glycosyltransferase involved in cell wall biosynthesis
MKDFILLIPCFNNTEGLVTSLKSIQYQPDKFEVLVVDDGSKTPLNKDALKKEMPDIDIKILWLPTNMGVAKALNEGLKSVHNRNDYKYIARLDCGDTCHSTRFTEQVKYMDKYSEISLLGSWCIFTDTISGKNYTYKTKTEYQDILKEMHLKCSFIHPTVMFRKEVLDAIGYYPETYRHAEDYAYFWKILLRFKGSILPLPLVSIAVNRNNISSKYRNEQLISRIKIIMTFGNNNFYKLLGILRIRIMQFLPYSLINKLKYSQ